MTPIPGSVWTHAEGARVVVKETLPLWVNPDTWGRVVVYEHIGENHHGDGQGRRARPLVSFIERFTEDGG